MAMTSELVTWTEEALERLYDVAFLRRHARSSCVFGRFDSGRAVQEALLSAVKQLKPPANVSANSPAWRIYNVLQLRYVQGLTQPEAIEKLNISLRQLQREQPRAVEAVATVLLEEPAPQDVRQEHALATDAPAPSSTGGGIGFMRLDESLQHALYVLDPVLRKQHLTVNVDMVAPPPRAQADEMVGRQLLISALSWIASAACECALSIEVTRASKYVVFRVSRPLGFGEGFVKVPPDRSNEQLEAIRKLAQAVGGQVDVEAIGPDEGAGPQGTLAVQVRLPTSIAHCVLMVDDNEDEIQLVRRYLQKSDEFHLVAVTQADEAIAEAISRKPDCILLDVMMPGQDGWDLLTRFRAVPETSRIPIIVSSIMRERELARTLGANDVLPRPYNASTLIATLRSVIK